jgi:hypothetical protein
MLLTLLLMPHTHEAANITNSHNSITEQGCWVVAVFFVYCDQVARKLRYAVNLWIWMGTKFNKTNVGISVDYQYK